jgi:hypothetical protein
MTGSAAHPARGAEFGDRLGPFAGAICHQANGFPHHRDPAALRPRRAGVAPGELRVVVRQCTGRDQVIGDELGPLLAQAS